MTKTSFQLIREIGALAVAVSSHSSDLNQQININNIIATIANSYDLPLEIADRILMKWSWIVYKREYINEA